MDIPWSARGAFENRLSGLVVREASMACPCVSVVHLWGLHVGRP